jgi:ubiquinone/menaquinone biosynthesis C-methylase UbiE
MPFPDRSFDGAYMLHVGMNIEDKEKLASEVARVLRPGSVFGIYDVMRTGPGELAYPVPWAARDLSSLASVTGVTSHSPSSMSYAPRLGPLEVHRPLACMF